MDMGLPLAHACSPSMRSTCAFPITARELLQLGGREHCRRTAGATRSFHDDARPMHPARSFIQVLSCLPSTSLFFTITLSALHHYRPSSIHTSVDCLTHHYRLSVLKAHTLASFLTAHLILDNTHPRSRWFQLRASTPWMRPSTLLQNL